MSKVTQFQQEMEQLDEIKAKIWWSVSHTESPYREIKEEVIAQTYFAVFMLKKVLHDLDNKMKIKTITCKRTFSLGNYESRHLDMTADISDGEDPDVAATELITTVERKVRERVDLEIQAADLKDEIKDLKKELARLKNDLAALTEEEPDPSDIPFKSGSAPSNSEFPDGF